MQPSLLGEDTVFQTVGGGSNPPGCSKYKGKTMYLKFLALSFVMFILELLVYPLVPIAVLFADKDGRLPKGFRWLETHDALGWGAGTYEPPIQAIYEKYGKQIAMIMWLWRNKAYTLRHNLRANPNYDTMILQSSGVMVPPKWGFFYWKGTVVDGTNSWFELVLGISFGKFYIFLRNGWKLKPYFNGDRPTNLNTTAVGMFVGFSIRSDDWDDFPPEQRPE